MLPYNTYKEVGFMLAEKSDISLAKSLVCLLGIESSQELLFEIAFIVLFILSIVEYVVLEVKAARS